MLLTMYSRSKCTGKAEVDKILIVITFLSWNQPSENTIFGQVMLQIGNQQPRYLPNSVHVDLIYIMSLK